MSALPNAPRKLEYQIGGMDCASCAATIRSAVSTLPGVAEVDVSVPRERMTLTLLPGGSAAADIEDAVRSLGYSAVVPEVSTARAPAAAEKPGWWTQPKARQLAISAVLIAAAAIVGWVSPALEAWAFGVATLLAVWPIARRAVAAAQMGTFFTIQMLMTLAAIGALIIGEQAEAAVVVLLFQLGEMLEGLAASRARAGIQALGALLPRDALVEGDQPGELLRVDSASLRIGQVVLARPGDRIAADGVVLSGVSSVDESPVTGESVPVTKQPDDIVRAGTVNHEAALRIRVDRAPEDNTIARIIALVEQAQDAKAPTERFIERFSRVYMPAILALAVLVAVVPPLLGMGDWVTWIYRGLALLLIGCPCALVISVPAAVAASLAAGARAGILIKSGAVLEAVAHTRRVVFDKTGTLTIGRPVVTDIAVLDPQTDEAGLLAMVAAVERESTHPLAAAIVARAEGLLLPAVSDVRIVPGKGMEARIGDEALFIGAPLHAAGRAPIAPDMAALIAELEGQGKTVVVPVRAGRALGLIALRDEPRPEARAAMQALKDVQVTPIMMTGDNPRTGEAIGRQLGIEVEAGMLPEDKARRVAEIAARDPVMMVGDGVNDAPALASAQVGVAIGSGTDVAMEAADAALVRDRVDDVARMIALSRATMANIRQNVAIALGLKALFLVTTVTGVTGLWLAIMADTGATVLVTMNALRLLGYFRKRPSAVMI